MLRKSVYTLGVTRYQWRGFKLGPFSEGTLSEAEPETRGDRRESLLVWWVTVAFIFAASPAVGLLLAVPTALYLIARAVADTDDTGDQS